MPAIPSAEDEANTTYAHRTKAIAKHRGRQHLRSKWESKALHHKYPQLVKQADVNQDKTHRWLKAAGLKAEIEGFIIAVYILYSDNALSKRHILEIYWPYKGVLPPGNYILHTNHLVQ